MVSRDEDRGNLGPRVKWGGSEGDGNGFVKSSEEQLDEWMGDSTRVPAPMGMGGGANKGKCIPRVERGPQGPNIPGVRAYGCSRFRSVNPSQL